MGFKLPTASAIRKIIEESLQEAYNLGMIKGPQMIKIGDKVKIISILNKGDAKEYILHTQAEVLDINHFLDLYYCEDVFGKVDWHHLHDLLHLNVPPLPVGLLTSASSSIKDPDVKPYETRQDYEINKRKEEVEKVDYEKIGEDFANANKEPLTDKKKKDIINNIYEGL